LSPDPKAPVHIQRIGRSKADLGKFFDVADRIYAGDPNWVAPLRSDVAKVFQDENPFFRHGEMQLFLAFRGSQAVGRVPRSWTATTTRSTTGRSRSSASSSAPTTPRPR